MNKDKGSSSDTMSAESYCIEFSTAALKLENKLAALTDSKFCGLSSGPLSPGAITTFSSQDSAMSDDDEHGYYTSESGEASTEGYTLAASTESPTVIAKIPSSSNEALQDSNVVVMTSSEGEASEELVTADDSTAAASAELNLRSQQGGQLLATTEERPSVEEETELVPQVSMGDFEELRRVEEENIVKENGESVIEPMKILRKGAVAALGGTIVAVGLIMIPLPTPCGALVASSGMAVLGTEFDGAREMNEKVVKAAKKHWGEAREKMIKGIEEMEGKRPTMIGEVDDESEHETGCQRAEISQVLSSTNSTPLPIMNAAEQKRQEELAKLRSSKAKKPDFFDHLKRSTGAYLSRHLLPHLKRSKEESEAGSIPDIDISVQSETETLSERDQEDELGNEPELAEALGLGDPAERTESKASIFARWNSS